jgi:transcriptional regulator with GAF, ATPase, and Fis domain
MNRQIITHDPRDRVTLLYRLSQTFNSSLNLDEVLNRVIDEVITAIHAENGFMVLRQADGKLDFPVARGMDRTVIDDPQSPVVLEILSRVIEQGKPVLISNTMVKNRSTNHRKRNTLESISILCVPLTIRGNIIGALYLENCCDAGVFSQEDVELLDTIGASAAIAIENARSRGCGKRPYGARVTSCTKSTKRFSSSDVVPTVELGNQRPAGGSQRGWWGFLRRDLSRRGSIGWIGSGRRM